MSKIIIMRGIPGSGKSTLSKKYVKKHPGTVRINRDDLRDMSGLPYSKKNEGLNLEFNNALILKAFDQGYDIIIDNTNMKDHKLLLKNLSDIIDPFKTKDIYYRSVDEFHPSDVIDPFKCGVYVWDVITDVETCIDRDIKRERTIGSTIISNYNTTFNKILKEESKIIPQFK